MSRDGPGLLLRDIAKDDPQIEAIIQIIIAVAPDVIALTDFDFDYDQTALTSFRQMLGARGLDLPHQFSLQPNGGVSTGLDLDQNGYLGEARDAQGYGRFVGQGGLALLSRWPIDDANVQDFSTLLWQNLPGARLPVQLDGTPWPQRLSDVQRLSSTSHWIVHIAAPDVHFDLLVSSATPPVFDGPEDLNGHRNRDELLLWQHVIDGKLGDLSDRFILAGNTNLDPVDGDGFSQEMRDFLDHSHIQDPMPASLGGVEAADPDHLGDPALDTADWPGGQPGNLRVSYVLPSSNWRVTDAGVFWPARENPEADLLGDDGLLAGSHRLVWVDLSR